MCLYFRGISCFFVLEIAFWSDGGTWNGDGKKEGKMGREKKKGRFRVEFRNTDLEECDAAISFVLEW